MPYSPFFQDVYDAAFSGALAGMAVANRYAVAPTPTLVGNELIDETNTAGAFAEAVDTLFFSIPLVGVNPNLVQSICEGLWSGRQPSQNFGQYEPNTYQSEANVVCKMVTQAVNYYNSEGLPYGGPSTGGGGGGDGGGGGGDTGPVYDTDVVATAITLENNFVSDSPIALVGPSVFEQLYNIAQLVGYPRHTVVYVEQKADSVPRDNTANGTSAQRFQLVDDLTISVEVGDLVEIETQSVVQVNSGSARAIYLQHCISLAGFPTEIGAFAGLLLEQSGTLMTIRLKDRFIITSAGTFKIYPIMRTNSDTPNGTLISIRRSKSTVQIIKQPIG